VVNSKNIIESARFELIEICESRLFMNEFEINYFNYLTNFTVLII